MRKILRSRWTRGTVENKSRDSLFRSIVGQLPALLFGAVATFITAFATPLGNRIVGGQEAELQKILQIQKVEIEAQKKELNELGKKYEDKLDELVWKKTHKRNISYQIAILDHDVSKILRIGKRPNVDILGINATGPLHQGREVLKKAIAGGGLVRILVVDPESKSFEDRTKHEHDTVGRMAAELFASLHIVRSIREESDANHKGNIEIRLLQDIAQGSLFIVSSAEQTGLVMDNPYPSLQKTRGLEGLMYKFTPDEAFYKKDRDYFEHLWATAEKVALVGIKYEWPFRRLGRMNLL